MVRRTEDCLDMPAARSPWLIAFGVVAVIHLILNAAGTSPWDSITKVMIVPLLAAWTFTQGGPRIIVAALIACTFGDLFLIWEGTFTIGMAAFAIGHLCFIRFFVTRGALNRLRATPWIVAVYAVAAIALIAYAWSGLAADIRPLVPIYAALLAAMASTSLACDNRAGLGGALFLVSDGIILLGEADKWQPAPSGVWIMALYVLGLLFLASGILDKERNTLAAGREFDPAIRTDCWPRLPVEPTA